MNKSKSVPVFTENLENIPPIKKTTSLDELKLDENFYFEEFFEGDGLLGIVFAKDHKNNIIVKNILENTVASETYGLYKSMILINIDNRDIKDKSLDSIEKTIRKKWLKNSRIYLKFKKPIYQEVYTTLLNNNLSKYYDQFVELGAASLEDFEFVEYEDLIKMNMSRSEIEQFRIINPNI